MKPVMLALLLLTIFVRCTNELTPRTPPEKPDQLTIRTGTSFGMCAGYCQNDYVFNGTSATLTQGNIHIQAQVTPRTCQSTITQDDWNTLKLRAIFDEFSKQPKLFGCPDCTDGGAEYVEIQLNEEHYRVTFPFGKTIPGFEALVTELRAQRNAFKDCL